MIIPGIRNSFAILILLVIIVGVVAYVYTTISNTNTVDLLDASIETYRADSIRRIEENKLAREHIAQLEKYCRTLEQENTELERILSESKITLELIRQRSAEIRKILDRSIEEAGASSEIGKRATEQIDRALDIIKSIREEGQRGQ